MLLWLSSVYWVRTLDTPKWDILATDVAVYFDSKLRTLKLQTYQSISPAMVREKPPKNAKKEGKLGVEGGKIPFTCRECCRNEKVYHIYHNLYPGWQKLPQSSTASSYLTSYIKLFILENKFPLCILFPTLIYNINIIHMGVTLAELHLLGKNTRHSQVGYIGHRCGRLFW